MYIYIYQNHIYIYIYMILIYIYIHILHILHNKNEIKYWIVIYILFIDYLN